MGQRRLGKRLAIVLAAAGLSMVPAPWAGASGPSTPAGDTAAGAADDEFAGLVDIGGGRRLYLECRGSGSPTVVFESGSGDAADVWSMVDEGSSETAVLPAVAEFTRVCAYDRPGTKLRSAQPSRSDPVDLPRAVSEIVADLHALLDAADVPGPYVLVAHSMGGMLARLYAGTYPDEVAGFVSVDAAHEIYYEAYQELLPPELYMAPGVEIDVVAAAADMRRRGPSSRCVRCRWSCWSIPETENGFRTRSACRLSYRSKRWSWPSRRRRTTWPPSCPARST